jgi:hypothetical protein
MKATKNILNWKRIWQRIVFAGVVVVTLAAFNTQPVLAASGATPRINRITQNQPGPYPPG